MNRVDASAAAAPSAIQRLDVESGRFRDFDLLEVTARNQVDWAGMRMEHWDAPVPSFVPESVFPHHTIGLTLSKLSACSIHWPEERLHRTSLLRGNVVITPAGTPYWSEGRDPWNGIVLSVTDAALARVVTSGDAATRVDLGFRHIEDDAFVSASLLALAQDARNGHPWGSLYGESLCAALAVHLTTHYGAVQTAPARDAGPRDIAFVQAHIARNLSHPLRLAELAALAGLTSDQLVRAFKAALGMPPHRYVTELRIAAAKDLLSRSNTPSNEIADLCGFGSPSHFSDAFKRVTGLSPRGYRAVARH